MSNRRTDIAVVTSCSAAGWQEYGHKCLPKILEHWPSNVTVHLASEDQLPLNLLPLLPEKKLYTWSLSMNLAFQGFMEQYKYSQPARGKKNGYYSYTYDAYKFSKKVFALDLVARHVQTGRLIWLDADVETYAPLPLEVLLEVCPDHANISHLARKRMHSECGFVGYNLNLPGTREFIYTFANVYSTGQVFRLKEWHDSFVFDWLLKQMAGAVSTYEIPHTNEFHPFNYSVLGQYMDHWKGNRKRRGYSYDHPKAKRR